MLTVLLHGLPISPPEFVIQGEVHAGQKHEDNGDDLYSHIVEGNQAVVIVGKATCSHGSQRQVKGLIKGQA